MNELILGPPVSIGDNYFDKTLVALAKQYGLSCPTIAPPKPLSPAEPQRKDFTGDADYWAAMRIWWEVPVIKAWLAALNEFELLHYYDLPLVEYITYSRTQDPFFLGLARKCADAWASHPTWIGNGTIQLWPDNAAPPPRHAGIPGLILRAMDDRPDLWYWINGYTDYFSEIYVRRQVRVNAPLYTNPREAAFTLQAKAYLAVVLPDSFPTPTGTSTDGAAIRAGYIVDLEAAARYYASKQREDGAWVWDEDFAESDGGLLRGIMQPFIVGLLLQALCDVYEVVGPATKEIVKTQILKGCRHLYEGGPYIKDQIEQVSGKRVRGFHYYYHGGTTVNPTRYANGDIKFPWVAAEAWWLPGARQAISTILPAFGKAYQLSGDEFYKIAGDEMFDSAYNGTDGMRALMDSSAKNFNQHARRVGSYQAWRGGVVAPPPPPPPVDPPPPPPPDPLPDPLPPPDPPPPDGATSVAVTSPENGEVISGRATVKVAVTNGTGITEMYLIVDGQVIGSAAAETGFDTTRLADGQHSLFIRAWKGNVPIDSKPPVIVTVKNAEVEPPPIEPPPPVDPPPVEPPPVPPPTTPKPCSISAFPSTLNIPRNSTGVIAVSLNDLTGPTEVRVTGFDGQVGVSPLVWNAGPTSTVKQFQVRVKNKKLSKVITFSCSCGSVKVTINVI